MDAYVILLLSLVPFWDYANKMLRKLLLNHI